MGILGEVALLFRIPRLGASPEVVSPGPEHCPGHESLLGGREVLPSLPPCASHPLRLLGAERAGAHHRSG